MPTLNRFGLPNGPDAPVTDEWQGESPVWEQAVDRAAPFSGVLAGMAVGLVGAVIYATVMVLMEREFALLAVVVGIAVGWAVPTFWGRRHVGVGVVAGVIAAVAYLLSALLAIAGFASKEFGYGLGETLAEVLAYPGSYLTAWIEADGIVVLFFVITVVVAFTRGAGFGKND